MDSDSGDLSSPPDDTSSLPAESVIEKALCDAVISCYSSGDLDSLTLKRIRIAVTEKLDLPEDFLKTDSQWKDRSKETVNSEVSRQEAKSSQPSSGPVAPKKRATPTKPAPAPKAKKLEKPKPDEKPKPVAKPKLVEKKPKPIEKSKLAAKRKSTETKAPAKKRQKTVVSSDSEEDDALSSPPESTVDSEDSEPVTTKPTKPTKPTKHVVVSPPRPSNAVNTVVAEDAVSDSDSDLSSVIDASPPPKSKRKNPEKPPSEPRIQKAKPPTKEVAPQDEEIKRLQGWLVKCGIRKLWGKELAPFSSSRDKIAHLKDMLKDAGMGSRYSEEKARQIKEERELKADLEDIVERERQWGQSDDEDAEAGGGGGAEGRPKRRLAKGLKELQIFADDEESSS